MVSIKEYLRSTVGKKVVVALSGLGVAAFTLTHVAGNMLILVGPAQYNAYSHALISNPLIYFAEAGLLALFLIHIILAVRLYFCNRSRRGQGYALSVTNADKGTTFAANSMIYSGSLLLAFLVLHLISFKYGTHYDTVHNDVPMRDLHRLVVEKFKDPIYVGWYVFSMLVLWLHMSHGIAGAFQSLGVTSSFNKRLRCLALGFTTVVVLGFLSQPLYVFFGFGGF